MPSFYYVAEYAHGCAEGTITADDEKDATARVKAMYHGLQRDTFDSKGRPVVETTKVTNVKLTKRKEPSV